MKNTPERRSPRTYSNTGSPYCTRIVPKQNMILKSLMVQNVFHIFVEYVKQMGKQMKPFQPKIYWNSTHFKSVLMSICQRFPHISKVADQVFHEFLDLMIRSIIRDFNSIKDMFIMILFHSLNQIGIWERCEALTRLYHYRTYEDDMNPEQSVHNLPIRPEF